MSLCRFESRALQMGRTLMWPSTEMPLGQRAYERCHVWILRPGSYNSSGGGIPASTLRPRDTESRTGRVTGPRSHSKLSPLSLPKAVTAFHHINPVTISYSLRRGFQSPPKHGELPDRCYPPDQPFTVLKLQRKLDYAQPLPFSILKVGK